MEPLPAVSESVFDYRSTEFLLLALGVVMTIGVLIAAIWLLRAAIREHRTQLEREEREREASARSESRE
jgi:heme exporter protein D